MANTMTDDRIDFGGFNFRTPVAERKCRFGSLVRHRGKIRFTSCGTSESLRADVAWVADAVRLIAEWRKISEAAGHGQIRRAAGDANVSAANHPEHFFEAAQQNCHEPCVRQGVPIAG
jgi:hypothetical protein